MTTDRIVDSPAIGWSKAETMRRLGWRGFLGGSALSALTFALAVTVSSGGVLGVTSFLSLMAAMASAVLIGVAGAFGAGRRPGRLVVTSNEIIVQAGRETRRVQLTDIADGWVEDPHGIRLRTKSGTVLSVAAPDAETAEAVLRAAGVSVSQRVLAVELTSQASRMTFGVPISVVLTGVTGLMTLFFVGVLGVGIAEVLKKPEGAGLGGLLVIAFMLCLFGGPMLGLLGWLARDRVTIGVDGIAIQRFLTRKFIPYGDVTRVDPDVHGVRIGTKRGDVLLPTWKEGEAPLAIDAAASTEAARKQRVIFDRIRRAVALRRPAGPELAALDRGGRPVDVWRDELRALAKGTSDYRRVQLDAHDLEEIVTDATAPAERRIAAVMALAGADRPAARDRVRIAIDTCADDDLKAALEQAAEDELEDETLRKAIRGV